MISLLIERLMKQPNYKHSKTYQLNYNYKLKYYELNNYYKFES